LSGWMRWLQASVMKGKCTCKNISNSILKLVFEWGENAKKLEEKCIYTLDVWGMSVFIGLNLHEYAWIVAISLP
jgi:hypothetical protein